MARDPLDEFSGAPLTPIENKKARKLIRDQERIEWVWGKAFTWGAWVGGGLTTFYALKDRIIAIFKAALS